MKKMRYIEIFCILALALSVGIFLPLYISSVQEEQLLNQPVMEAASAMRISRTEKMEDKPLLEKFMFLLGDNVEYIEYITMSQGKSMDLSEAQHRLESEIYLLLEPGGYILNLEDTKIEGRLYTAANAENPAQSLIVWKFYLYGVEGGMLEITLDDATGKIIGIKMLNLGWANWFEFYDVNGYEEMAYLWGSYLQMSDMELHNIFYAEISAEQMLKNFDPETEQLLDYYGVDRDDFLDNYEMKKKVSGEKLKQETGLWSGFTSVRVDLRYNLGNGKYVDCLMDWGGMGFGFSLIPEEEISENEVYREKEENVSILENNDTMVYDAEEIAE